ncbi:YIP1 family protein [Thermodesulfobacteriota bacterium]
MNCPHCGREYDPSGIANFCSHCGGKLTGEKPETAHGDTVRDETPAAETEQEPEPHPHAPFARGYCPWEDQDELGFFEAIMRTIKETLFDSEGFFTRMPVRGGFVTPLLYALIVTTLGSMVSQLFGVAYPSPLMDKVALPANWPLWVGLLTPFVVFIMVIVWAVILHVSLFIVGGASDDLEATFRVSCYASTPELLNIIPVYGGVIGFAWRIYVTVIGIRTVHRTSTGKAIAAVVLPSIVCCALVVGVVMLGLAGLGMSAGT